MTLFISNPSRGGATPSNPVDPVGVKAVDPIRISLRDTDNFVDLGAIQLNVGYARVHGDGAAGEFDKQLPRTRRASLFNPSEYVGNPTISVVGDTLVIQKTSGVPMASTYFTSVDRASSTDMSAMFSSIFSVANSPSFSFGDPNPLGPLIGLEHGPRNTAVYCFFLTSGGVAQIRICGPSVQGVRVPDIYVPYSWDAASKQRYALFWNETKRHLELWGDAAPHGVSTPFLIANIPLSSFQQFGTGGSVRTGGANDITGVYGVEGPSSASAGIVTADVAVDVGFPFNNGARIGGWKTYLDSDVTVGFSGGVDPTRLNRGGAWFKSTTSADPLGQITPSAGGFCRLLKKTASTNLSIFRDEPGFQKTETDGLVLEFKCATSTTGGVGFGTGAAIQVSDGSTLFQLDFLFDGNVHNIGLLRDGGNPTQPSDHLLAPVAIDYTLKTLRLVVDPRRGLIDLFDAADLAAPVATWTFDRSVLPASGSSQIVVGLPVTVTPAIGAFDIYSLKYTYLYRAWETRDSIAPTAADPPFTSSAAGPTGGPLNESIVPGIVPLPYSPGFAGSGTGSLVTDGYQIASPGGTTLFFSRDAPFDGNRGGILEARLKITSWHPAERSGVFCILDDGNHAYMLSFVETDSGRFVCVPLSAGSGNFQEYAGETGQAAKLSVPIDWTKFHTYRLESRPRDGVYLFIDNTQALVLPESAHYSFPLTQLNAPMTAFGQFSEEGATSVWKFVRDFFGSGYEISTELNQPESDLRTRLNSARTTIVVTAGA